MLLNDYPHQQHVEYEQDRGEVQVVDVVQCRDYVAQTELENEVQYNVNRDDDLSSDSRNLLPEEAAQQANKDRGVERSESRVYEARDAAHVQHERGHDGGNNCYYSTEVLTDLNHACIGSGRVEQRTVNIECVDGGCGVQYRVEGGQDRAEHYSSEEAQDRLRHNLCYQHRVSGVAGTPVGARVSQCADNARNNDDQRSHDLEEACKYGALLCFLQVLSTEGTLDNGLVGCPVVHVVDQQTGEQQRPREPRLRGVNLVDGVQVGRIGVQELVEAVHKGAIAAELTGQEHEAEYRNQQAADDQAEAVDGVGQCDCLQAAEDSVDRAYDSGCNTDDCDCCETGNTEHLINAEDVYEYLCACVQDVRQHDYNVAEQYDDGNQTAGAFVVALLKELRNGGQTGLQVLRHQDECEDYQSDCRGYLPAHGGHADANCLTVVANELFCGKVGHQQRTGDDRAGQAAAAEIVAVLRVEVVTTGFPPRDECDECRERHEGDRGKRHGVYEVHLFLPL